MFCQTKGNPKNFSDITVQLVAWLFGCWLVVVGGCCRRLVEWRGAEAGRGHRTSVSRRPFDPTLGNKFCLSELRWTLDNLQGSKETISVIDLLFETSW